MKVGIKILGASTLLGSAEIINNGCAFLRNLILARLLSKEDFGIAAVLALMVSLFELTGKLSFGQQVIQSKMGDNRAFQDSTHTCQLLTSVFDTILILVFAYPLARWFGMEAHRGALMLMAIIPFCAGLTSLENYRLVRHLRFTPLMLTDTLPQVTITLAAWPLAAWLRDYRAILSLLLVKAVFSMITSHLIAERPYRLCWEPKLIKENLRFGWPLLLSGFLMFGIFQGDRMLIAGTYSLADLGTYAVAATIAMTPCFVVFRISGTITLPIMAQAQDDPAKFREYYRLYVQILALCSAVFVVGMILGGEATISLLFGKKYASAAVLALWMMVGQAFRILRGAPICAAMARADTINTLSSNLWRLSGLVLAVPVVLLKLDLYWVAIAGGIGEALALSSSIILLRKNQSLPLGDCAYPASLVAAIAVAVFVGSLALAPSHVAAQLVITAAGCSAAVALFGLSFGQLRHASIVLLSDLWMQLKCFINRRCNGVEAS